jgi:para-nitrobenzyl esterase
MAKLGMGKSSPDIAEDCLTLNVWTPAADAARRPVMVWIHGGSFTGGSGASPLCSGRWLAASSDVVVVTVNYRLGILGFLAHGDLADEQTGAAGNWGLLDQMAALRWVQESIGAFGGDPANVTLFGESAGAVAVVDLLAVPSAEGLFSRAICQSGPARALSMDAAESAATKLTAELGMRRPADLREVPVDRLLEVQDALIRQTGGGLTLPVVDGAFFPLQPVEAVANGASSDVSLIVGTNRDERKLLAAMDPRWRNADEPFMLQRLEQAFSAGQVPFSPMEVSDAYRTIRASRGQSIEPVELWTAIETDRVFRVESIRLAEAHSQHQPNTYMYLFEWESPVLGGAAHAVDIPFVFGALDLPGMDRLAGSGPAAEKLATEMQGAWAAFASTGQPGPTWPRYDSRTRTTKIWGQDTRLEDAPFEEERQVWSN